MGVTISEAGTGAFIALVLAVVLIGVVFYARRTGHLRNRGALVAIAALIGLMVAYGMSGGLFALT